MLPPVTVEREVVFLRQNLTDMADLNQDEWRTQMRADRNAVILDVRTEEEIEEGYIAGAQFIDFYQGAGFLEAIDALDKSKSYYIYCRSGNRSGQACAIMNSRGFENTFNLAGGIQEWEGDVVD